LPSVKTDASLPTKGDGAGAVDFPRYTELPLAQGDSAADLGSRILIISVWRSNININYCRGCIFMFGGLIETMLTPKIYSASTTIKIDRSFQQCSRVEPPKQSSTKRDSTKLSMS
jgi:hypothetical protein